MFALLACFAWGASIAGQDPPCPSGPFETDRYKIAAVMASMPSLPSSLGREAASSTKPEALTFTDGVGREGGGGLMLHVQEGGSVGLSGRAEYDANHSLLRYVRTEATLRSNHLVDERYFTKTVRPTVEQARSIACLVNQLLNPPMPSVKEKPALTEEPSAGPAKTVVITASKPCSVTYTDGHWERLEIRVGGAAAKVSSALSCSEAGRLEALLSGAVNAPFLNAESPTRGR